jgi:hypothetical protein
VVLGDSYLSTSRAPLLFGLGEKTRVDAIEVRWPDGSSESFPGTPSDRRIHLKEGLGKRV